MNEWTKPRERSERPILIFFRAEEHVQSDKLAEKVDISTQLDIYIKVNFIHEKLYEK